eukprot:Nk52_evm20s553 gene=Nk52_evmTU20s553
MSLPLFADSNIHHPGSGPTQWEVLLSSSPHLPPQLRSSNPGNARPPFKFDMSPEEITSECDLIVQQTREVFSRVAGIAHLEGFPYGSKQAHEQIILPLLFPPNFKQNPKVSNVKILTQSPRRCIREAARAAKSRLAQLRVECSGNFGVYSVAKKHYTALCQDPQNRDFLCTLREEDHFVIRNLIRDFEKKGACLEAEQYVTYKALRERDVQLCTWYTSNLEKDDTLLYFTREELAGCGGEFIDSLCTEEIDVAVCTNRQWDMEGSYYRRESLRASNSNNSNNNISAVQQQQQQNGWSGNNERLQGNGREETSSPSGGGMDVDIMDGEGNGNPKEVEKLLDIKPCGQTCIKYVLTLARYHVQPVLDDCENEETRMRTMKVMSIRGSHKNIEIILESIKLRSIYSRMIGFPSYADYALEQGMVTKPAFVIDFLKDLKQKIEPTMHRELEQMQNLKKAHCEEKGAPYDGEFNSWDFYFYHKLMLKEQYGLDEAEIMSYFELNVVKRGIFRIVQEIFGLILVKEDICESEVWARGVELYSVFDRDGGELLGHFYLDILTRAGKYSHSCASSLLKAYGDSVKPCMGLLCNFGDGSAFADISEDEKGEHPKTGSGTQTRRRQRNSIPGIHEPVYLTHGDVVTFFHEFGHCVHGILNKGDNNTAKYSKVPRDFVEAPGLLFEYFCFDERVLKLISGKPNRETGEMEPLPKHLLNRIYGARNVNAGMNLGLQLWYSIIDLEIHFVNGIFYDTVAKLDEFICKSQAEFTLIEPIPGSNMLSRFGHIMSQYQSLYYGYVWSHALSADLYFERFARDPLDPKVGREYREVVLEPGGLKYPSDIVKTFLGRPVKLDNFMRSLNLLRNGFLTKSCEVFGADFTAGGFYDYGPLGVELKRNIQQEWWQDVVLRHREVHGIETCIVQPKKVWEGSGHLENFHDPMSRCRLSGSLFRVDKAREKMLVDMKGGKQEKETEGGETESDGGWINEVKSRGWFLLKAGDAKQAKEWENLLKCDPARHRNYFDCKTIGEESLGFIPKTKRKGANLRVYVNKVEDGDFTKRIPAKIFLQGDNQNKSNNQEQEQKQESSNNSTASIHYNGFIHPESHSPFVNPPERMNLMLPVYTGTEDAVSVLSRHWGRHSSHHEGTSSNIEPQLRKLLDPEMNYLRPETAQGGFTQFLHLVKSLGLTPPFGMAQVGKSFRNEINTNHFIFRSREFEQMELQYFVHPKDVDRYMDYWMERRMKWWRRFANDKDAFSWSHHSPDKLAHYSKRCSDIQYAFPWGKDEIEGVADRGCFDLAALERASGQSHKLIDHHHNNQEEGKSGEAYLPNCVEPSAGLTRAFLVFLCDALTEEEAPHLSSSNNNNNNQKSSTRTVLKLHPRLAPIKAAILPVVRNNPQLTQLCRGIADQLAAESLLPLNIQLDDSKRTVGQRYKKHDLYGTPLCFTADSDSLEDGTITMRDRDTCIKTRIPISDILPEIMKSLAR